LPVFIYPQFINAIYYRNGTVAGERPGELADGSRMAAQKVKQEPRYTDNPEDIPDYGFGGTAYCIAYRFIFQQTFKPVRRGNRIRTQLYQFVILDCHV